FHVTGVQTCALPILAGLDGEAKQSIGEAKLDAKTALVLGAEGRGLRRLTAEHCDYLVKLPMSERMESLNVSNAAAVALYELYRRSEERRVGKECRSR